MLVSKLVRSGNLASGVIGYPQFVSGFINPTTCECRLSLYSGSVTTNNTTSGVYIMPYKGNRISLYVSGSWQTRVVPTNQFVALNTSGFLSGQIFDCYLTDTTGLGNVQLRLLSGGGPATQIYQDSVLVLSGVPEYRYIGTGYSYSLGSIQDQFAARHLYNYYNRIRKIITYPLRSGVNFSGLGGGSGWQMVNPVVSVSGQALASVVVGVPEDMMNLVTTNAMQQQSGPPLVVSTTGLASIPTATAGLNGINPSGLIVNQTFVCPGALIGDGVQPFSSQCYYIPNYGLNNFYLWKFQVTSGNIIFISTIPASTATALPGGLIGSFMM